MDTKINVPCTLEERVSTKSGKPYLENGPFFNVSHSEEYVVFVSDESREVGVDIEKINENKKDMSI